MNSTFKERGREKVGGEINSTLKRGRKEDRRGEERQIQLSRRKEGGQKVGGEINLTLKVKGRKGDGKRDKVYSQGGRKEGRRWEEG